MTNEQWRSLALVLAGVVIGNIGLVSFGMILAAGGIGFYFGAKGFNWKPVTKPTRKKSA